MKNLRKMLKDPFWICFIIFFGLVAIANTAIKGPVDTAITMGIPCVLGYCAGRWLT